MIWFYMRDGNHLRCEIRQQVEGGAFELVIVEPDGTERIERFDDSAALHQRSRALERQWREQGWDGPFARGI